MEKVLVNYEDYKIGFLKETIFGMSGKGHKKGTRIYYRLTGLIYEYLDVVTGVVVKTEKLCV